MKIRLDRTICDGFGTCAARAPGYFSLDDWGYASLADPSADPARAVLARGEVAPEDEAAVNRAILDCPIHAITVLEQ
jgi:ferredoxin